ncbi:MAG: glycosyltransferase family 9 protein [Smithellaceae bacterium]|nr:glycosyltransferase family 9 protein [Smithellaceae bacterium]
MNILLVKLSAIGDVVHTLPSLGALRRLYPQAHITWVVEEAAADLVISHPWLDQVIVLKRKSWLKNLRQGKITASIGEIKEFIGLLRARDYDLVIDFHGLLKSSLVVLLSGGKRKVGFDSYQELSGLFVREKVNEDMGKHAVDRYLDLVRHLGANPLEVEFLLPCGEENKKRAKNLIEKGGIGEGEPFVAVNPIALWETKLWPEERFARLCDLITGELGVRVVLTGTQGDRMRRIASLVKIPVLDLTGQTSLKDLLCLYRMAKLVVTTDTGPMHIAAAAGTPVIALFGPTDPKRTGPYGAGHRILQREHSCRPCFKKKCDDPKCLLDLTVEEVFLEVKDKLGVKA